MTDIIIGFSSGNSLLSKTIQAVQGTKYSHAYIRRKSKYGEYVYQASGLAVNFMNINIFLKKHSPVEEYVFNLNDDQTQKLMTKSIELCGAGYQISSLFKLLVIMVGARLGFKVRFSGDGESQNSEFICSELAACICKDVLNLPIEGDLDFITPKDLNPVIKQYGQQIL